MCENCETSTPFYWTNSVSNKIGDKVFDYLKTHSRQADVVKSSYHAAAIVYRNQILATGVNRRKTHPLMRKYQKSEEKIYLHAEVDAIIKFMGLYGVEMLENSSLYVLRTTKTGKVASSKPCDGCMRMISAVNIKNVYWT